MESMEMKKCSACNGLFSENNFRTKDGRLYYCCKNCEKEKQKEYNKRPEVIERNRLHAKKWRKEHYQRSCEIMQKTRRKNWSKIKVAMRNYMFKRKHSDPVFKLKATLRHRLWCALKSRRLLKKHHALDLVGCSAIQLKEHLEGKFREGMTWENHSQFGWHVDHIRPLINFDFSDPEQIKTAFHYTNLQPLWWYENIAKRKKDIKEAVA